MAQTSFKAVIGPVRFSFLHVFEPHSFEGAASKYSAVLLIPKSDTKLVEAIQKAIQLAYDAAVTERWGGKKPIMDKVTCLHDGDSPKDDGEDRGEAYKGMYFLNAKSSTQPGIVDKSRQPIIDPEELYSGCWGYASIAFSGYDSNGARGISCFLNNIMKTKDDERLGSGKTSAADDFADIDFGDDEL